MKFTILFNFKRAVAISSFSCDVYVDEAMLSTETCIGEEKHLEFKKSVSCLGVCSCSGAHSDHVSSTTTRCRRKFADYVTRMAGVCRIGNGDRAVQAGDTFGDREPFYFTYCSNAFYDKLVLKNKKSCFHQNATQNLGTRGLRSTLVQVQAPYKF
jgi:hypothetical protein